MILHPLLLATALAGVDDTAVVQVGLGPIGADRGPSPGLGWYASLAWMWGDWADHDHLTGKYQSFGLQLRQDVVFRDGERVARTAPLLEYRRGLHLLVAGGWVSVAAGPLFTSNAAIAHRYAGGTVRAALGLAYRAAIPWSVTLRLEAGVDVTDRVSPALGLTLGFEHIAKRR
jgi:hypothetical protein